MPGPHRHRVAAACAAAIAALMIRAGAASADPPCAQAPTDWEAVEGALARGAGCGRYVATTNGARTAYSLGQLVWRAPVTVPYRASVTWRRLGADPRALELGVLGGVVMVADDRVGLWIDDASFELDGWRPLPGHRVRRTHAVTVIQRADELALEIDGAIVARWKLRPRATTGRLSMMWKGAPADRGAIWFAGFAAHGLAQPSAARPK
ncbi:MAG: hypothetical protein IPH44_09860 [Myxococcales bacterium]|nr:hypothetical protein [Myxococcales bacterium]MBK7198852.1 hypothetical protein [Myxococcales bacterium]MBP6845832.1 hypothetical protein [Kofleriaceae bacterium]